MGNEDKKTEPKVYSMTSSLPIATEAVIEGGSFASSKLFETAKDTDDLSGRVEVKVREVYSVEKQLQKIITFVKFGN